MEILSQRPRSVVIAQSDKYVEKLYTLETQWRQEASNLSFLREIQGKGFSMGCNIPELVSSSEEDRTIGDKTYKYCNVMQRLYGTPSGEILDDEDIKVWSNNLAEVIFTLHYQSKQYVDIWVAKFGKEDNLLEHILQDKAARTLDSNINGSLKPMISQAAKYLEVNVSSHAECNTLSHQDINRSNILIDKNNKVDGLVDWVDFGLTNPTLSLYQLVVRPTVWKSFESRYTELGGVIDYGVLYAAAVLHLAWALEVWYPSIAHGLNMKKDSDETYEMLEEMIACFKCATG